jgi:DNA-binding NarL/FixJ family response regulator
MAPLEPPSTRVLLVDDTAPVRESLRTVLGLAGGIEIVGEAANGQAAIDQALRLRPQVVVMDLEMPVLDGYEATRQIKRLCPACRVVALTIHAGEAEQQRALAAGVDVFVAKGAPLVALVEAICAAPTAAAGPTAAAAPTREP